MVNAKTRKIRTKTEQRQKKMYKKNHHVKTHRSLWGSEKLKQTITNKIYRDRVFNWSHFLPEQHPALDTPPQYRNKTKKNDKSSVAVDYVHLPTTQRLKEAKKTLAQIERGTSQICIPKVTHTLKNTTNTNRKKKGSRRPHRLQ